MPVEMTNSKPLSPIHQPNSTLILKKITLTYPSLLMLSIGASGILELAIGYAILHVSIADLMAVKNVMNIFN